MGYTLRQSEAEGKCCQFLTLEALERVVLCETINTVFAQYHVRTQRERKLTLVVLVWVVLAMQLYAHVSLAHVLRKLAQGLRFIWPDPTLRLPRASALTYRRELLGSRPLVALFPQLCVPMATPQTAGAFRFALRLMALDGPVEDLPATPENMAVFGRHHRERGQAACPQVQRVVWPPRSRCQVAWDFPLTVCKSRQDGRIWRGAHVERSPCGKG